MRIRASLLAVAIVGVTSSALATDTKVYPGMACQNYSTNFTYTDDGTGALKNTNTGSNVRFTCPIVRDQNLGTSSYSVAVTVDDVSNTAHNLCQAHARTANGTTVSFGSAGTTDPGVGISTLSFTVPTTGSGGNDYFYMYCDLHTNAKVRSYKVTESTQTD